MISSKRLAASLVLVATAIMPALARAQIAPAWSRGLQQLSISVSEATRRAEAAMQAEGYNVTNRSNPSEDAFFLGGQKGQHSAIIMCDRGPDGKTWVNVVVATNGTDSDVPGAERQRLQARMNNGQASPVAPQSGPGGGYGPGSGPVDGGTRINGTWTSKANELEDDMRSKNGRRYTITFPPNGHEEGVWGTDLYTADSKVGTAAVHAGLITFERGGTVTIEIRPDATAYRGSARNGISSLDFGYFPQSFVFITGNGGVGGVTGIANSGGAYGGGGGARGGPANAPQSCAAPGTYLQLINKSDRGGEFAFGRDAWKYDVNTGTGSQTSPSGRVDYKVEMPALIPPEGAEARMTMTVTAFAGRGGKDGVIGFLGEVEPESQVTFQVKADAGQTKTDSKTFIIKPRPNYSEGYDPVPLMRLVGGLDLLFKYHVVHCRPDGTPANLPPLGTGRVCAMPGIYLELINKSERDGEFAFGRDAWKYDVNTGTGSHTSQSGSVQYKVEMPAVIGPDGAEARMTMTVNAFAGRGGKDGVIGFLGEVEPESQVTFQVKADAGQVKTDSKTFVLKPRPNYSDGYDPVPLMRLVGGLDLLFKYRVVHCPRTIE